MYDQEPRTYASDDRRPHIAGIRSQGGSPRHTPPSQAAASGGGSGARLSAALLLYMFGMTVLVTLTPFDFTTPRAVDLLVDGGVLEALANVVLFLPLGFLWRLTWRDDRDRWAIRVLGLGLLASLMIEGTQFFLPSRFPALQDLAMNALGAMLGARAHDIAARRLDVDGRVVSGLGLELPLMTLVYLLVPLLWLNAVAVSVAPLATLRLLTLGLFGASLLAAVQRRHLGPAGALGRRGTAAAAAAWFLVGAFPALPLRPAAVLLHTAIIAALAAYLATGRVGRERRERRFELEALRRAAPFFAAYLLLIPLVTPAESGAPLSRALVLEAVQAAAASTLLGFMVAEARGRRERRYRDTAAWVVCWAALAAGATAWLGAATGSGTIGTARLIAAIVFALYGGWVYHLQRARIRAVVRMSEPDDPSVGATVGP